ncbi:MAG: phosphate acetyltransferase [Planctomycetota bacterium]
MDILSVLREKAASSLKRVVLPEISDDRVIEAAVEITREKLAHLDLVGDCTPARQKLENSGADLSLVTFHDIPSLGDDIERYATMLFEKRKHKGMTLDAARELVRNPIFFGAYLVAENKSHGMVAGATCPTADTIRASLFAVGTAPGCKLVSSFFIIVHPNKEFGSDGVCIFADPSVNPDPSFEQLADIAIASADNARVLLGIDPRVAMLSFSTKGSAEHALVEKGRNATAEVQRRRPDLAVDGEMQFDAACIPSVGAKKAPGSPVAGRANVFVFPDLNACNIGSKIAERFGGAAAVGPVLQGLAKPINDLSRGCKPRDIADLVAITAVQAG